jgi:adenylosuccinate lyase
MAGRTHLQHALPITFGYKCAVYLSSFQRYLQRLNELEARCLTVQFGGAAGTLASFGPNDTGIRVRKRLAGELGLHDPTITWHVARDNIAEIMNFLALIGGSLGKVALDIILMSSNEIGEVSEPFVPGRGASSTMPQKRNPISSEVMLAASKTLRANAGLAMDAMVADFERPSGPWHLEWFCVPESFVVCCGALRQACFLMNGIVVHEDAMLRNLGSTKGRIVGEAVMMGLAEKIGRGKAHDAIYEACSESIEKNISLFDALKQNEEVIGKLDEDRLRELCDPFKYLGCCKQMVDNVIGTLPRTDE